MRWRISTKASHGSLGIQAGSTNGLLDRSPCRVRFARALVDSERSEESTYEVEDEEEEEAPSPDSTPGRGMVSGKVCDMVSVSASSLSLREKRVLAPRTERNHSSRTILEENHTGPSQGPTSVTGFPSLPAWRGVCW
jgi:hypothetical protein